ncbi:MAG: hypothetical protein WBA76_07870 [Phormidesmis sp.]
MSVHELNQMMTYITEGWMLFSAGFIGTTFISFVSRRIQEDIEAAELAQTDGQSSQSSNLQVESQQVTSAVAPTVAPTATVEAPPANEQTDEALAEEIDAEEIARLEEIAAVSEKLAKEKEQQSNASSVSVST